MTSNTPLPDIECLVIGAGVIGLAVARAIARTGREVVVAEAGDGIGEGISSRNSEVIHAGIYYPQGSLKARFCVDGKRALYRFCSEFGVEHKNCGKIIVATNVQQRDVLSGIAERAARNGVDDLRQLSRADLHALEPALNGDAGLLSPSTGIIDTHSLMLALQGDLEAHGGALALRSPVLGAGRDGELFTVQVGGETSATLTAGMVVIAAGLHAPLLARRFNSLDQTSLPKAYFAKGNYFSLARRAPFSRLIYPVPEPGGLGVHLTLDMAGRARFGPDVEWLDISSPDEIDYRVDPQRSEKFYAAIRRYWPDLRDGELAADYSGVRPKIVPAGQADADFTIMDHAADGMPGLIGLYGIESPGITSCLAIADHVSTLAGSHTARPLIQP
jgi:L-2-hydroxyglutarate oxidase LhgO